MLDPLDKLMDELEQVPIVELLGVVSPGGVGGGRRAGDKDWLLHWACFKRNVCEHA